MPNNHQKHGFRLGLLPRIIIAIILGIALGNLLSATWVRVFITFNAVFSQLLGFMIPLIIVGLVTPAIADVGNRAGKMLLATVAIAYLDTLLAAAIAYATGTAFFPSIVEKTAHVVAPEQAAALEPYFSIAIPPLLDVMSALVLAFIVGLCIANCRLQTLQQVFTEFRTVVEKTISAVIIPLLPLYIFGIFLNMTHSGEAYRIMIVFAQIIVIIFALHIFILLYEFIIAGGLTKRNPLRLLLTMLPAYFTALGTSSSAATIPVTLEQTRRNGVSDDTTGFTVPLCATIHMPGSAMKITACALAICLMNGLPHTPALFLHFILMLGIVMVAAPGVPGGAIMAALAPLSSILGFSPDDQALIIALYIAMDSFGTACNVTGDGAIALVIDKWFNSQKAN